MKFCKEVMEGRLYYEQPGVEECSNLYFKAPNSRENIVNLFSSKGLDGLIEPNIEHKGCIRYIGNFEEAKIFDSWNKMEYADGICIPYRLMKEHNFGVFARSADSMILTILAEDVLVVLNVSIDSLNHGILKELKDILDFNNKETIVAFEGPCICSKHLKVYGTEEYVNTRLSKYGELGYSKYLHESKNALDTVIEPLGEKVVHVDLRGIVTEELRDMEIENIFIDDRCTFEDISLGSAKRSKLAGETIRRDNVVLMYIK